VCIKTGQSLEVCGSQILMLTLLNLTGTQGSGCGGGVLLTFDVTSAALPSPKAVLGDIFRKIPCCM
jgi:hypothetical protein